MAKENEEIKNDQENNNGGVGGGDGTPAQPAAGAEAPKPDAPNAEAAPEKKPMNKWVKRGLWAVGAVACIGLAIWGGCALCKEKTETSSDTSDNSSDSGSENSGS